MTSSVHCAKVLWAACAREQRGLASWERDSKSPMFFKKQDAKLPVVQPWRKRRLRESFKIIVVADLKVLKHQPLLIQLSNFPNERTQARLP